MARAPLKEISVNRAPNYELSPYQRGKIERSSELGQSIRTIAKDTKLASSTVQNTLHRNQRRNNAVTLRRSGRPRKYTERDVRRITHFVRVNPKVTYADIRQNTQIQLSHDTLGRILDTVGIKNWRTKGRPTLDSGDVKVRYTWTLTHYKWTTQ